MCDLNGPFKLCACSEEVDYSRPHWMLQSDAKGKGFKVIKIGLMSSKVNLFLEVRDRKIESRLNSINVFDFDYKPKENDQLTLFQNEDDGVELCFNNGKWRIVESLGDFIHYEYCNLQFGKIESKLSELTRVYEEYHLKRKKEEPDVTVSYISGINKITEKQLIKLMKAKIKGDNLEFP